jgi:hypothetical protein
MKTALFTLLVVLVGLLHSIITDMLIITWLSMGVGDITGNYFMLAILPAEIIAVGITTLVLMKAYKYNPRVNLALYVVVGALAHSAMLNMLANPLADIAAYFGGMVIACGIWFSLLWRFYLNKTPA